jgi:hypothetical protein
MNHVQTDAADAEHDQVGRQLDLGRENDIACLYSESWPTK